MSTSDGSIRIVGWCRHCGALATAMRFVRASPTAQSMLPAPITHRSMTTGKQLPFGEAEPGATGLELLLPLTLKWAQDEKIPLPAALARLTANPAAILGLDAGNLAVGQPADVCISILRPIGSSNRRRSRARARTRLFSDSKCRGRCA
jgi:dihydroorotase-like cyclic amidohydrolase